jgi:hypothetical protein
MVAEAMEILQELLLGLRTRMIGHVGTTRIERGVMSGFSCLLVSCLLVRVDYVISAG